MTRRELMARLGSDELMEWLAFDRICPLPDFYWMTAMIAYTFARVMGARGVTFDDFLPNRGGKPKKQTGAQMMAVVRDVVEGVERRNGSR